MSDYKQLKGGSVLRSSDGTIIPSDTGNYDWREYQDWLAAGNTPDPVDPEPPPTPTLEDRISALETVLVDKNMVQQADLTAALPVKTLGKVTG